MVPGLQFLHLDINGLGEEDKKICMMVERNINTNYMKHKGLSEQSCNDSDVIHSLVNFFN